MSLQTNEVSICEFQAFKTLDCYTIHYQNCITYKVSVAVYNTNAFRILEYNIERVPADLVILRSKGLNLADFFYCVGLMAPHNNSFLTNYRWNSFSRGVEIAKFYTVTLQYTCTGTSKCPSCTCSKKILLVPGKYLG